MISWFFGAFFLSMVATVVVRSVAIRFGIVDRPTGGRKIHAKAIPLLGGLAIFLAIAATVDVLLLRTDLLTGGDISVRHYVGFLLGGTVLMVGGFLDDKLNLSAKFAIVAPVIAAVIVIALGIEITKLTNPFGGVILLEHWQSNVIVFVWLMVVMYTTKFLDGLDGLATGVSSIGTLMVLLLASTAAYFQPDVAAFATVCLGAMLGFLAFNFHPAKIFLGEGGSTFVGFIVGTLAVISGGKLATALLVLAIPMLDVVWIMVRRFRAGGLSQVFKGDRKHLHHRLLDRGWTQTQIVAAYYLVAIVFGCSALFLQSREKLIALAAIVALMLVVAIVLSKQDKPV